jgi:diguanylate cyclase (GGDEF)-like protein/PAS domain S-box-containing protein
MDFHPVFNFLISGLLLVNAAAVFWYVRRLSRLKEAEHCNLDETGFSRIACLHANDGLVVMNMNGIIQWVNPAYCRLMGYDASEMIGRNPRSFALLPTERPDAEMLAHFRLDVDALGSESLELCENIRKDGTVFWNQINMSFHTTQLGNQFGVVVCRDVTTTVEREKQLEAKSNELAEIAASDHLTGAASRAELSRFLDSALKHTHRTDTGVGVLHIDLDKFKQINDTHGHSAGDAVLVATAERLRAGVRDKDLVARIGGDEFVVVCCDLKSLTELKNIGNALSSAVNKPVNWQNSVLNCQISVGAALSDAAIKTADEMLVQSDFALYDVKRNGRGRVATYNAELHLIHTRGAARQTALKKFIRDKSLTFHFQPVVARDPGIVRGLETLVRWQHPTEGMIPPDELLPLAQSLGLMADLDFLAMNAALDMKVQLNRAGHDKVRVSFNASPEILAHPDFRETLLSGLAFRDLTPDDVIVEVLETVVFENHNVATPFVQTVAELNAAGIFVVLDDFGSGNAGIAQLAKLAIKGVKFDKSISMSILTDPTMEIVYKTLVGLCNELNLRMVTEGVETADQAARLHALGCTNIQGYLISKPLSPDATLSWLHNYTASAIAPEGAHRYLKANS